MTGGLPSTIKGSWLFRTLAILAVCSLLVGVPAAVASTMPATGTTLTHGDPGKGMSSRLHQARTAALTAYRDAHRAVRRAGEPLRRGRRLILHSSSVQNLQRAQRLWLHRTHRYQHIVRRRGLAIRAALHQRGVRYVWGGASPAGFDCSGLTMWAYARAGVELPHSTYGQIRLGHRVSRRGIRPGDLVFSDGGGHVGLYLGHGMVVHAPHAGTTVRLARLGSWPITAIRRVI
ncbi:MAG: peptidoglycan DL-endopeptidase CwlO [Gaiellales bacterium]|jgi:hypothetical protein|nr:peptidoglycan DL-endopeptidase CwlO [Gaiellales bacterium]